jgi:hypothetical protein
MPTFLQVVELPTRCFLREVLLWTTFQRLPVVDFDPGGFEIRESAFISKYCVANPDPWAREPWDSFLHTSECRRAGIPPHPLVKETLLSSLCFTPDLFDQLLNSYGVTREEMNLSEDQADVEPYSQQDMERAFEAWKPHYDRAVEYFQSRIFVALRNGQLKGTGRLLNGTELSNVLELMEKQGPRVEPSEIPAEFWTLRGIDFENSAACDGVDLYSFITCELEQVLALFPGDRQSVEGVERIGDYFVLEDALLHPRDPRGRPPHPWEGFHLEVASILRDGSLPPKKEAAIQLFQEWFQRRHGITVSRSAIGQKLTPYYDRFLKRQKI